MLLSISRAIAAAGVLLWLALAMPGAARVTGDSDTVKSLGQGLADRSAAPTIGTDLAVGELVRIQVEIDRVTHELAGAAELIAALGRLPEIRAELAKLRSVEQTICAAAPPEQESFGNSLGSITGNLQNITRELPAVYPWESSDYSVRAVCDSGVGAALVAIDQGIANLATMRGATERERNGFEAELQKLQGRRQTVLEEISRGAASNEVTRLVPYLVGIIFMVGAVVLAGVKLFGEDIQRELISSGQIVQFVTILILLSVILALGLSEKLTSETLGTLLGGLAGYVLSQGVGRHERQRVIDAIKAVTPSDGAPTPEAPPKPATA